MTPPSGPHASLEQLLCSLFDAEGLRRHLKLGPEGPAIAEQLPERASLAQLVHASVEILIRRGLVDVAFFDRLRAEFPARAEDIRATCGLWISARPQGDACPPIPGSDSSTDLLGEQLELAYRRREERIVLGADSGDVDHEILELRRTLRRGPQLRPGESLLAGRYRLISALGSGGFATVWKAYDRETRTLVALKVLHGQWSADRSYRERFARGARTMLLLRHPNIVRVLREPCDDDGFYFYVMELIDGTCMHRAVRERQLPISDAARVILTLCDALAFAHERGYIHRDIKPANILLDRDGGVFLSDFDLIRGDDTTGGTRTGAGLGTLLYAAPEALSDAGRVDARADVYSTGMTLLFAALGRELRIDDLYDTQMNALATPPAITPVIYRATARHLDRRYPSILEFKAALQAVLPRLSEPPLLGVAAAEPSVAAQIDAWVYQYSAGHKFSESFQLPRGRLLRVATKPWYLTKVDAILHPFDTRQAVPGPLTRELESFIDQDLVTTLTDAHGDLMSAAPGDVTVTSSSKYSYLKIFHVYLGEDIHGANPEACKQLLARILGRCADQALPAHVHSLAIPGPFFLSEQFSGPDCLREILLSAANILQTGMTLETIHIGIVPHAATTSADELVPPSVDELVPPAAYLAHCIMVDYSAATGGTQRWLPLRCNIQGPAEYFLNDVWFAFPLKFRPPSYSYGQTWSLRRVSDGAQLMFERNSIRSLRDMGLDLRDELEAVIHTTE